MIVKKSKSSAVQNRIDRIRLSQHCLWELWYRTSSISSSSSVFNRICWPPLAPCQQYRPSVPVSHVFSEEMLLSSNLLSCCLESPVTCIGLLPLPSRSTSISSSCSLFDYDCLMPPIAKCYGSLKAEYRDGSWGETRLRKLLHFILSDTGRRGN